jgi:hypothetical protein
MLGPAGPLQAARDRSIDLPGTGPATVWRWCLALAAIGLLSLLLALNAAHFEGAQSQAGQPATSARLGSHSGSATLSAPAQAAISRAVGARDRAFRVRASRGGFLAINRPQRLRARFGVSGVTLRHGALVASLGPPTLDGSASPQPGRVAPQASSNMVTYRYGDVNAWYANGPLGLEQGFVLARPPAAGRAGLVTISMKLSGNMRARVGAGAQGVSLRLGRGPSLLYGGLRATDASGRTLTASLALRSGNVVLRVDTRGARYPLRIDPLVQQGAKLTGGEEETTAGAFGFSVALSGDGSTALVGVPDDHPRAGAVWVFVRVGSAWVQQGPPLNSGELETETEKQQCNPEANDENSVCGFGASVAVSADGNTALIGSPIATEPCPGNPAVNCANQGAAWIYTRSGSTWTRQGPANGPTFTGGGEEAEAGHFGRTVALSADGSTAIVAAPADRNHHGSVWVFARSGATWVQQGPKLIPTAEAGEGYFGLGLALSADGNTALIGGPGDNMFHGGAWVFVRSGSSWLPQGGKLTGGEEIGGGRFGRSVALSSNASEALIGGFADDFRIGAAWAFHSSSGVWSQQGPKLTGGEGLGESRFGRSVALSGDGATALIGGPGDEGKQGAAWTFTNAGAAWSQSGKKLVPHDGKGRSWFGYAVALSAAADTALIGGPKDTEERGAAWVFVPVETEPPPEEEPPHKEPPPPHKKPHGAPPPEGPTGGLPPGLLGTGEGSGVLPFGPVSAASTCRASLLTRNAAVNSKGRASFKLQLLGAGTCRQRLTLTIKQKASHHRSRTRTIASGSFSLAAGRTVVLTLKLNALGRKLLHDGHGRLGASLAMVRLSPGPVLARSASVRLTLARAHGKSAPKH